MNNAWLREKRPFSKEALGSLVSGHLVISHEPSQDCPIKHIIPPLNTQVAATEHLVLGTWHVGNHLSGRQLTRLIPMRLVARFRELR